MPGSPELILGIGDDAALVSAPDGRVVAATDLLIEGSHFRRDWSAAADIGARAAARNLVDVAAMGARPTALLVGLAAPPDLEADWVLGLARGLATECAAVGAGVAGGDTSASDTVMLAVTALGDLAGREPVTRRGARPGDVVAVAGELGSSAAGYALLAAAKAATGSPDRPHRPPPAAEIARRAGYPAGMAGLIRWHLRPSPPYAAGPEAARAGATAMIDVSDGLVADLGHVAAASGVQIAVRTSQLAAGPAAPARARLLRRAREITGGGDWLSWALAGGEDHALAATFPAGTGLPAGWTVIGSVAEGSGVLVDGSSRADLAGWDHFRPEAANYAP